MQSFADSPRFNRRAVMLGQTLSKAHPSSRRCGARGEMLFGTGKRGR
jgi:hypothetical protein